MNTSTRLHRAGNLRAATTRTRVDFLATRSRDRSQDNRRLSGRRNGTHPTEQSELPIAEKVAFLACLPSTIPENHRHVKHLQNERIHSKRREGIRKHRQRTGIRSAQADAVEESRSAPLGRVRFGPDFGSQKARGLDRLAFYSARRPASSPSASGAEASFAHSFRPAT